MYKQLYMFIVLCNWKLWRSTIYHEVLPFFKRLEEKKKKWKIKGKIMAQW